jgi:hypothetical protein
VPALGLCERQTEAPSQEWSRGLPDTLPAYRRPLACLYVGNYAVARRTGIERADAIDIRFPIEGADNGLMAEGA